MAGGTTTLAPGITELNPGSGIYGNQQGQETDAQGNVLSQTQNNTLDTVYRANGGGALSTSNPNLNPYGDTSAQQSAMNDAAANFWSGGAGTTPMSFAGGTLQNNGDGTATFTPAGGAAEQLNQNMSFAQMAALDPSGDLATQWNQQFGTDFGTSAAGNTGTSSDVTSTAGMRAPQQSIVTGGNGNNSPPPTYNQSNPVPNAVTNTTVTGTPAGGGFNSPNQFEAGSGVTPNVIGTNAAGSGPTTTSGSVTGGTPPTVNQGTYSITPGTTPVITGDTVAGGAPATMASAQEGVDPNMTVEGNLGTYLGAGNPAIEELMQQVGTVAGQNSNAGNVFHSSMESQAVADAMLNVANGDATQDANMYAGVASNNANLLQSAFNTNATLANNFSMAQLSSSTQQAIAMLQARTNLAQTQMSTQQAETVASLNNWTQVQVAGIDASNSMLIATNQDASQAYNQFLSNVENAMVNTQDPTALNTEISQLTAGIQAQLAAISAVSGVKIPSITTLGNGSTSDQSSGQPGSGQAVQGAQAAPGQPQVGTQGPYGTVVVGYDNTGTAVYGPG